MDDKLGIATDRGIPWRLPEDVAYFRQKTKGGVVLMGGTTYREFSAPMSERENIVLTRSPELVRPGFRGVASLDEIVPLGESTDLWVIGGAVAFGETLTMAAELLITQVHGDFECTVFFPPFEHLFELTTASDERHEGPITYRFETWRRRDTSGTRTDRKG